MHRISAFKFGGTEVFPAEIERRRVDKILSEHMGTKPPLSMPVEISAPCFREFYELGTTIS